MRYALEKGAKERRVTDFEMVEGQGIRAAVDGVPCMAGNQRMLLANGLALSRSMQELGEKLADAGKTPLFFAANRQGRRHVRRSGCAQADEPRGGQGAREHGHRGHAADRRQ